MENTDTALANLIERLQVEGLAFAPELLEGATRAVWWDGLFQLLFFAFFSLLFLFVVIPVIFAKEEEGDKDTRLFFGWTALVLALISIGLGLIGNPWVKTFAPEAALYQQILERALNL